MREPSQKFCFLYRPETIRGKRDVVRYFVITIAVLVLGACGSSQNNLGKVRFARTARVNYEQGMASLEHRNWDRSRRYFRHVRREFPYSRFASLAELRLADCEYGEENFSEAATAYRRFLRLHPTHPQADHAAFRRGLSYYKTIPSDWFLVPPSIEKDMSATRDALRELRRFVREYPQSKHINEARELVRESLRRLASHEIYVAKFYLRRSKHQAAIGRTKIVERRYSDSGLVGEAMFLRGETYLHMGNKEAARNTFLDLAERYPQSHEAKRAYVFLGYMGVDIQAALTARQAERSDTDMPLGVE